MNLIVLKSLLKSLNDENPRVRAKAAESLGKIKDESTATELNKLLKDEDPQVRTNAKDALLSMGMISQENKVPEWNQYFPSLEHASKEQNEFYNNWLFELEKSNHIDLEGNLSYIFVYLYSVLEQFLKDNDINHLETCFNRISEGYGHIKKIKEYLIIWKSDAYMYIGDYDNALNTRKEMGFYMIDIIKYATILSYRENNYINGHDLFCMLGNQGLTKFGLKYQEEIEKIANIFLDDFFHEHGKTLVAYFLEDFNLQGLTEANLNKLKIFYPKLDEYEQMRNNYIRRKSINTPDFVRSTYFRGYPSNMDEYMIIKREDLFVPEIILKALRYEVIHILREAENTYREEKDLPKVGEGWISETELFYKIKEVFPNDNIVHHGRPSWLGRQHLDIYFQEKNIGIEYQGEQHQEPHEYFGGEKAFKLQKKRDERKLQKCKENGCSLIYVYPDYDFEDIEKEIKEILN
ncbi:TerB N-terminal domain-containing protein [Methanobacterium sp.]|uniref:TerB N-terminal domain-containing protein n=1 Tax=Methanobacterium sp. TaxID=2164 RepID=UPI0031595DB6